MAGSDTAGATTEKRRVARMSRQMAPKRVTTASCCFAELMTPKQIEEMNRR
jgi:hypothetical protein